MTVAIRPRSQSDYKQPIKKNTVLYLTVANEGDLSSKVQYRVLFVNINVNKFKNALNDGKTQYGVSNV